MVECEILTLDITRAERERIEAQALEQGYETAQAYLLSLVDADVATEVDEVDAYFDADPEATFRQSWHEAMTDQTHPVATLWDDLEDK